MPTIKKRGAVSPGKQEQEIVTIAHIVTDYLAKYGKQFMIAGSVLALILAAAAIYAIVQAQRESKAGPLVAAAYEAYSPSNGTAGDYVRAIELFREAEKKYSGVKSAAVAQYYIGNSLANLGRPDEAIMEYQAFIKKYSGEKFLLGLVRQRMGYVYQGMGRQDEARKSFDQAETLLGPGVATMELARIYEATGNKPGAEEKYKVVADKLAGTSWSVEAMGKVQKIAPPQKPVDGTEAK